MLKWNNRYSVGIRIIDEQHHRLLDIINELEAGIRDGQGKETLATTYHRLLQYTAEHFSTEEELMRRHGFAESEEHAAEHADMARRLQELQQQHERDPSGLTIQTIHFLCEWLDSHLLGTDRHYMQHLHERGVR